MYDSNVDAGIKGFGSTSAVYIDWAPQKDTVNMPSLGARVISSELLDNHKVIFRLYAPDATKVSESMFKASTGIRSADLVKGITPPSENGRNDDYCSSSKSRDYESDNQRTKAHYFCDVQAGIPSGINSESDR